MSAVAGAMTRPPRHRPSRASAELPEAQCPRHRSRASRSQGRATVRWTLASCPRQPLSARVPLMALCIAVAAIAALVPAASAWSQCMCGMPLPPSALEACWNYLCGRTGVLHRGTRTMEFRVSKRVVPWYMLPLRRACSWVPAWCSQRERSSRSRARSTGSRRNTRPHGSHSRWPVSDKRIFGGTSQGPRPKGAWRVGVLRAPSCIWARTRLSRAAAVRPRFGSRP